MVEEDTAGHPRHTVVQHWVSVGDVLVLIASVVTTVAGLAFTYGGLSRDVDKLGQQVALLTEQSRGMTPGAAQEIAAIKAIDQSHGRAIDQIRDDSAEFRREVRESLARIELKLDEHDRPTRR